jgi:dTDP-3-amino-2,3,6-trideoxy-4-keto-D-glucose/dTDP-3-amino-3,4,6-trideoxy-alpha-D-glucose/dTDP-2,6-dideoxy-D-kanosamine transaminase
MNTVPNAVAMFDYCAGYAAIENEVIEAVREVLASGTLILGPRVRAFEDSFAQFLGGGHAVGVGNGTDALAIALRVLGVGHNDEVLTVANTAIPTASAIGMLGARPAFCDVDPRTCLMDPAGIESRLNPWTKAIVAVHLFGNAVDMAPVLEIAQRHNLAVVEDCAQACGTLLGGQAVGTFGDVGCFSFYPTKNLGAYGDGGLCVTRDEQLAEAMRRIRAYGCGRTYYAEQEGVNSRLDELHAAILEVKLRHLPGYLRQRRRVARYYDEHLSPDIERSPAAAGADHSYHLYVVQVEDRGRVIEALKSANVGHGIHYPTPIHLMSAYRFLGYREGDLPVTERLAGRILSLPATRKSRTRRSIASAAS